MRRVEQLARIACGIAVVATFAAGCDLFTPEGREPRSIYDTTGDDASTEDASSGFDGSIPTVDRCGVQRGGDAGVDAGNLTEGGSGEPLPEDFEFASDYKMRFSDFEFAESSPGTAANPFLGQFLDQSRDYPIVVLLHLKGIDPENGIARLRGGAGTKVDKGCAPTEKEECTYQWEDEVEDEYTLVRLDATTGELRGGLERLDFIGTTQFEGGEVEKFTLPIHDIYFRDALLRPVEDGVKITGGFIQGYVTREEAEENKVTLSEGNAIPIADLLKTGDMNYDSDGDGMLDAWCLKARFSAIQTRIAEN